MTNEQFFDWMKSLYGAFGKNAPALHVVAAAFKRVDSLPDGFFAFAAEQLEDRDTLPANLGRELRSSLWPQYLAQHPAKRAREDCPDCCNARVRFCWGNDVHSGRWQYFAVPCPSCQRGNRHAPATLHELLDHGVDIMPADYSGGPVGYDRDHGYGCLYPRGLMSGAQQPIPVGELADPRAAQRKRALSPEEREDYANAEAF